MTPNTISSRRWSQNEGKSDVARSANVTLSKVVSRERTTVAHRAHHSGKRIQGSSTTQPVQTLTQQAYRLIEEQIVTLRLKPGEILSEQGLSATIKIGRTPIREALQRLAREGLVTILPRKGILVTDLNPRTQLLALEVRGELERLLSRVGAERATSEQRVRFHEIARGMDHAAKTNNALVFMTLDRELNQLLIEAAHNDFAARSMKLLQGLSRRFWYMHYREAADLPLCARLHANQARAIANGNVAAAVRASDKLMDYVENFTRATVLI
jgi:DNA-binding GntR family transcriptional regulator